MKKLLFLISVLAMFSFTTSNPELVTQEEKKYSVEYTETEIGVVFQKTQEAISYVQNSKMYRDESNVVLSVLSDLQSRLAKTYQLSKSDSTKTKPKK